MFKYLVRYNVYPPDKAPQEHTSNEVSRTHMNEQALKKILETKHGAKITLISWREMSEAVENN